MFSRRIKNVQPAFRPSKKWSYCLARTRLCELFFDPRKNGCTSLIWLKNHVFSSNQECTACFSTLEKVVILPCSYKALRDVFRPWKKWLHITDMVQKSCFLVESRMCSLFFDPR